MKIGIQKGRESRKVEARPTPEGGHLREHGGDPDSVVFCHKIGMD